jgi:signal transduction histidine kinase
VKVKRSTLIVLLGTYVLIQFAWWASLLVRLRSDLHQVAPGRDPAELERWKTMIIGEGSVFFALLVVGLWALWRSAREEQRQRQRERNFTLAVTHELKTPLAAIRLATETLQQGGLSLGETQDLLEETRRASFRLERRIDDILQSARVGEPLAKSPMDPEETLESAIRALLVGPYAGRQVSFVPAEVPMRTVEGDARGLGLAWSNLIENALKYTRAGDRVEVALTVERDHYTVTIDDAGPGIARSERRRVLQPFVRLGDENTRTADGTGLGLYLADTMVRMHRGRLIIEDSPLGGTRIITRIPIAP